MGKTDKEKAYEKGVYDGQRGNFIEDFGQMGSIFSLDPNSESYQEGYRYGLEYRYDSEGKRYHDWDNSGTNDPKPESESEENSEETSSSKEESSRDDHDYDYSSGESSYSSPHVSPPRRKNSGCVILLVVLLIGAGVFFFIRYYVDPSIWPKIKRVFTDIRIENIIPKQEMGTPKPANVAKSTSVPKIIPTKTPTVCECYTVQKGDTLWSIAQKFYRNGNRWREIAQENNLINPNLIQEGDVLTIP